MAPACTGTNKNGQPCKATPLKGKTTCRRHADTSDAKPARAEQWSREDWLAAFSELGMVTAACEAIGISRQTVYMERQRNEDFAVAWADVEERSTERMEREAYRRAVEGVEKPMVSAGKLVTTVTEYSDGLLQFMLKARRPDRYRENVKVEHAGGVKTEVTLPAEQDWHAQVAQVLADVGAFTSPSVNGNGNGNGHGPDPH